MGYIYSHIMDIFIGLRIILSSVWIYSMQWDCIYFVMYMLEIFICFIWKELFVLYEKIYVCYMDIFNVVGMVYLIYLEILFVVEMVYLY